MWPDGLPDELAAQHPRSTFWHPQVIPLGPAPAGRLVAAREPVRRRAGCYGMYCSAILTTCPWWTVIQNGGLWWVACITIASLHRGSRMSLVALPV
jgi:hypothetical protein